MKQGFSLIELLVVVAIIGVLAGAGVVGYQGYLTGVRADTAGNQLRQIGAGLESAEISQANNLAAADPSCSRNNNSTISDCINALIDGMNSPYTGNQLVFLDDATVTCGSGGSDATTGEFYGEHTSGAPTRSDWSTTQLGQIPASSGVAGVITLKACDDAETPAEVDTEVAVDMGS